MLLTQASQHILYFQLRPVCIIFRLYCFYFSRLCFYGFFHVMILNAYCFHLWRQHLCDHVSNEQQFFIANSGMGGSQAEPRIEDAFSDEEGSGYGESPTRNSYPIQPSSGHGSTGGDLSDDDDLGPSASPQRAIGFESLCLANGDYSPTQHQQQCARSRSGSCASRRSQLSQFR